MAIKGKQKLRQGSRKTCVDIVRGPLHRDAMRMRKTPLNPALGRLLRAERDARNWSQSHVGDQVNVTRQSVAQWEKALSWPEPFHLRKLVSLFSWGSISFLGEDTVQVGHTSLETLPKGIVVSSQESTPKNTLLANVRPASVPPIDFTSLPRDVPVLRTAISKGEEVDFLIGDDAIDYVRRPPGLINAVGVCAVYTIGSTMYPRFKEGELVYLSASRPATSGDEVLIELIPDGSDEEDEWPAILKELEAWTPTSLICRQHNPAKRIEIDRKRIRRVWRVLPLNELLGV